MIAAIALPDWTAWVGFFVSTAGFIVTLVKWRQERADKRVEKAKREAAEAELRENRRRAEGPHLVPIHLHSVHIGQVRVGEAVGLGPHQLPAPGAELTLVVLNIHRTVFELGLEWVDGESVGKGLVCTNQTMMSNPKGEGSSGFIVYNFYPERVGREMRFRISFTTENGVKMHHVYTTRHGCAELKRIDPA